MRRLIVIQLVITFIGLFPFRSEAKWTAVYDVSQSTNDKAVSVSQTPDTGFIVLNDDMTVLKLSPSGSVEWSYNYYQVCDNSPKQILPTSDSGYIISATHRSTDPDNCTGIDKIWVIKLDAAGQILWQKTYSNRSSPIEAVRIREVPVDNGYIISGNIRNSAEDSDIWIIRIDNSGDILWQKTYSNNGFIEVSDIIYDQSSLRFVISGSVIPYSNASLFGFMTSLDINGNALWSSWYVYTTSFTSLVKDNSFYIASGTATDIESNNDVILLKVNSADGTIVLDKKYGNSDRQEYGKQIVTTDDNGYAFICNTDLYGLGSYDAWLTKIDSAGNVIWGRTFGGDKLESALTLYKTADSGFIVGGFTKSFPENTQNMNIFLMKLPADGLYDECTKIGKSMINNTPYTAYRYDLSLASSQLTPVYVSGTSISAAERNYTMETLCHSKDTDGDGILDDGDNSGIAGDNPCPNGVTTNCDDNCIYDCNVYQLNFDDSEDDLGDVCDRDPKCDRICGPNPCEIKCN